MIPLASISGVFRIAAASVPCTAEYNAGAALAINDIGRLISLSIPFTLITTGP